MNRALRRQQKKMAKKGGGSAGGDVTQLLQSGIQLHQTGDLQGAEGQYRKILELQPNHPEANHLLGTLAHQLGRNEQALPFLLKAVNANPTSPNFHNVVGLAYKGVGDFDAAIKSHKAAIEIDPNFAVAYNSLSILHKEVKDYDAAVSAARRALEIDPKMAEAHNNLGNIYEAAGRHEDAVVAYEKGLTVQPNFLMLHYNLARALQRACKFDQAITIYEKVIEAKPDFAEAYSNYGQALRDAGRAGDSIAFFQKAAELNPNSAVAYYNLGLSFAAVGQSDDAMACYEGAFTIKPDFAYAYNDHGVALLAKGQAGSAIPSLLKAVEIAPNSALMHSNLGNAYMRFGELELARASYLNAIDLKNDLYQAYNSLGILHQEFGEFDDAQNMYEKALDINPNYTDAISNMLFTANYDPAKSGEEIFRKYRWFNETFCEPLLESHVPHKNVPDPEKRIRVGYVAPTFYRHAVGYHLMPLFDNATHENFEVFAYAGIAKTDEYTERYKANSDHFIFTKGMTDEQLVDRIREDKIDILVDIAGHTKENRLRIFAPKPAPVSLHWLDFGYTTGMPAIDYYMGDDNATPKEQDHLFGEREVWRLDGLSVVYRPADNMGEVSPLPALANGYVTFCTLSRSVRLNDPTIRVWAEILKAVPNSKLRVDSRNFGNQTMCNKLIEKFEKYGVDADLLILGFNSPPWDVLREIDIALDCFPHNSGTTLFEHLYMGNPYVTLYNRASVGTLGGAILRGGGFGEWVAHTEQEYIDIAVKLASDIPALAETRANMRAKMEQSALMDEKGFVGRVEDAYRAMWRKWCATQ
ncbi:tetratricopeptide repeat protein [Maritalea sp.]|uniref:tetratricopeptide repeat protein n=1 Tax=Maritalea sp. TaxID=2003361 RepID=UPI003EF3EA0D